jgi:hypothetical protein
VLVDTSSGLVIRESQDVVFDESRTSKEICDVLREYPDADVKGAVGSYSDLLFTTVDRSKSAPIPSASTSDNTSDLLGGHDSDFVDNAEVVEQQDHNNAEVVDECQSETPRRNPTRDRRPPERLYEGYAHLSSANRLDPPVTIEEAKNRPDWPLWREATNAELRSLCEKGVYEDIPISEVPDGRKLIPTKWVYDYKTDHQDKVIGYKARLVAKGFRQTPGEDFSETYAPTIQDPTLRLLLQYAAEYRLSINQIDVKTAFLNGELVEEVIVSPPPGLPLKGRAWRLFKSLYGLKQAALAWYEKWKKVMLGLGFKPSDADPCLFTGSVDQGKILIGLYVDDALIIGSSSSVSKVVTLIQKEFEIKNIGLLKEGETFKFLGMELKLYDRPRLGISLTQKRYAVSVLEKFGMKDCSPVATPMTPGLKLDHEGDLLPEGNEYAAIVGSLLYLAVKTRPDIAHAVGVLSRFMSCPRAPHLQAAKRVLRYIARDPGAGLFFRVHPPTRRTPQSLHCLLYTDADFAADPVMRKSTSGLLFRVNGAPIMWRSKLQSIVAQSTCEAEFVAAACAVREGLWLQKLLTAVTGTWRPMRMVCDNESALTLLKSSMQKVTGRTKHIDVQFWFVLDHVMKGDIVPEFGSTEDMLADGFTKPYSGTATEENMKRIGMSCGTSDE